VTGLTATSASASSAGSLALLSHLMPEEVLTQGFSQQMLVVGVVECATSDECHRSV
jgi:hypothetical protein